MHWHARRVATAALRSNSQIARIQAHPGLPARLLAALVQALHESRVRFAGRELHRYRHLIQNAPSLDYPGCKDATEPKEHQVNGAQ
jgi:hypothetical protein